MVLDDIWYENYNNWNQLQTPFRQALKGSRVIVTTRKDITARMVIDNPTHSTAINLKGLSDDDCWCIFQQHANKDPDLADMQNDIVEKCKGLPLAAKALGGLLKSIVDKSQRRNILKSDIWSEESNVLPALRLSYQHLPSHLKCVFAYCSLFPKDYIFKETEVISLWIAQGFIPQNRKERMEDIGHGYFLDLVSRSLFEECSSYGRGFTMHDLIHDLALWAAGDLCYAMDTMYTQRDLKRTRHMFLRVNHMDETLGSQILASQLRTFLYYASSSSDFFDDHGLRTKILIDVQKFQYLRALCICLSTVEELPESIGDLKHLRFLKLFLAKIKVLPKSISKLCNLQTFDLRGCIYLEEVPHITYMVKLRHLYIEETSLKEMPLGMGRLKSLQTLDQLVLAAGVGFRVSELQNLDHLGGKLFVFGLENVTRVEDAQETQMDRKDGLDELYLHWGTFPDEIDDSTIEGVLEQLKPHSCIKKCVLKGYMGLRFPTWLGNPSFNSMVKIKLVNCGNCIYLPPLGQLPSLKKLKVEQMDSIKQVGPEFYGSPGCSIPFRALEKLKFESMQSWEKWLHSPVDSNRAFPCLETLVIKNCDSLQDVLPSNLASLKKLDIMGCKELSVALPSLPLLEELTVLGVSQLSTTEAVIFCSKKMFLGLILKVIGLPERCSYLCEELALSSFGSLIIMDQIPRMLRQLYISECHELQSLVLEKSSSSFYCLEQLTVRDCKSIVSIGQIPSTLRSLEIQNCEKLQVVEFKDYPSSEDDLPALQTLKIMKCKELNLSLPTLPLLEEFMISECKVLSTTADVIFCSKRMHLSKISEIICLPGCFPYLGEVTNISRCQSLITIDQIPTMAGELRIDFCQELQSLEFKNSSPFSSSCAGTFSISCCQSIATIRQIPLTLQQLRIYGCETLRVVEFEKSPCSPCNDDEEILRGKAVKHKSNGAAYSWDVASSSVVGLKATNVGARLTKLSIVRCSSLISLQQGLLLPFLQELHFSRCEIMEGLPSEMHSFTSLQVLRITGCPKIRFFPKGGLPTNLKSLYIAEVNIKQPVLEWGLHLLLFLEDLELINAGSSIDTVESIRGPDLLPSSLSELKMEGFPNLKSIYCSILPNLTRITIVRCPKFESFGDNHLPSRLQEMDIRECDLMEQHLKSDPNGSICFNYDSYSLHQKAASVNQA